MCIVRCGYYRLFNATIFWELPVPHRCTDTVAFTVTDVEHAGLAHNHPAVW